MYKKTLERCAAIWEKETFEETMKIFEPSDDYVNPNTRNQLSDDDREVEKFKMLVFFLNLVKYSVTFCEGIYLSSKNFVVKWPFSFLIFE